MKKCFEACCEALPFDFWNARSDHGVLESVREGFRPRRRTLDDRMTEMIIRDFRVITSQQQATSTITTTRSSRTRRDVTLEGPDDDDDDAVPPIEGNEQPDQT